MHLQEILNSNDPEAKLAVFQFDSTTPDNVVLFKFGLWARHLYPKYFIYPDAPFHMEIDRYNLAIYRGQLKTFTDIAFRNGAKTTRTKLFFAYVICSDKEHSRKYLKVLAEDGSNSQQTVTDIYNMLVEPRTIDIYPETFADTVFKREERMNSFTTSNEVKLTAGTVGTEQRGDIAEAARPDVIWFDDFETKTTLRSAVMSHSIWDNMEEAKDGLAKDGGCIYTCNYISERGNVHKLVNKKDPNNMVLITPIIENNIPAWSIYSIAEIENIKVTSENFEGEYLCKPSASSDVLFDRYRLDAMVAHPHIRDIAGFKIFHKYDQSHRIAGGADVAGGVGLDSSTSVFIDFDTVPAKVIATYKSNTIKPDTFGFELQRQGDFFGQCLLAPEKNNHGHATIAILKQVYALEKIFNTPEKDARIDQKLPPKEYGWHTNGATKPKMLFGLKKAIEDGLLELIDEDLIAEAKSYSRDDLLDKDADPRLTTRHFDMLVACAIAWQMKDTVEYSLATKPKYIPLPDEPDTDMMFPDIGV